MRIEATPNFVDFQFVRSEMEHYPSLAFTIGVEGNGFKGSEEDIWFRLSDLEDFLRQLEPLERTRQGQAELLQMSSQSEYCPFRFRIFSIDNTGNMAIYAEILKAKYIGSLARDAISKVSVIFEIDQRILPTIIEDFRALFTFR